MHILENSEKPFSITAVKKNGELIEAENVICTSVFQKNLTVNLKFLDSQETRTLRAIQIIKFNDHEIVI